MVFTKKMLCIFGLLLFYQNAKAQINDESLKMALYELSFNDHPYVEIDSALQIKYKDTIQDVRKRISGYWHFQGKKPKYEYVLVDTLSITDEGTTYVKNGEVFLIRNGITSKSNEIVFTHFDFSDNRFDSSEPFNTKYKELTKSKGSQDYYEQKTCQPLYSIVYFQKELGIFCVGLGCYDIRPIKFLSDKVLIIKSEDGLECYLKKE